MQKDCDVELELAVIRYTELEITHRGTELLSDLRKKSYYTNTGDKIVALGFGKVAVDHPESNSDADWHCDDSLSPAPFFVDPHSDRYDFMAWFWK